MAAVIDHQIAFKVESTPGTAVTPDVCLAWVSGDIAPVYGLVESQGMRPGDFAVRSDRVARTGLMGASGQLVFEALTRSNISSFLSLAMGSVATSGPTDTSAYTHLGTLADGKKTATVQKGIVQLGGTVTPYTYDGVTFAGFDLATAMGGLVTVTLPIIDAKSETTGTSLITPTYPSSAGLFHYNQCAVTIAGTAVDVKSIGLSVKWPKDAGSNRFLGAGWRQPQITGFPEVIWTLGMEFTGTTQLDRARATTRAAGQAKIVATMTSDILAGAASAYASLTLTSEVCDFTGAPTVTMVKGVPQLQMTAKARYDGTNNPLKFSVVSADTTA